MAVESGVTYIYNKIAVIMCVNIIFPNSISFEKITFYTENLTPKVEL